VGKERKSKENGFVEENPGGEKTNDGYSKV
jgi:hypothetical protein